MTLTQNQRCFSSSHLQPRKYVHIKKEPWLDLKAALSPTMAMAPARRLDQKPMLDDGQQAGRQSRNISIFN